MRRDSGLLEFMKRAIVARLFGPFIDATGRHLPCCHEIRKRFNVVDATLRYIHEDDAILHLRELFGTEHADSLIGSRRMHRDEVCERQDIFDRIIERNAQLASTFTRTIRVVGDDFHAERMSTIGHESADATEAEDGERLVIELRCR